MSKLTKAEHTSRLANVKTISIVTTLAITSRVVNNHILNTEVLCPINGEDLHRRVQDVQAINNTAASEIVRVEELRLGLAAV